MENQETEFRAMEFGITFSAIYKLWEENTVYKNHPLYVISLKLWKTKKSNLKQRKKPDSGFGNTSTAKLTAGSDAASKRYWLSIRNIKGKKEETSKERNIKGKKEETKDIPVTSMLFCLLKK